MRAPDEDPDLVARDPLDVRVGEARIAPRRLAWRWALHQRLALGLTPSAMPGLVLLVVGAALGPHGISVLSPGVLAFLEPAIPVALAALGVLVGLGVSFGRPREHPLLAAASLEAGLTVAIVAAGTWVVSPAWAASLSAPAWVLACALGTCAATSSTVPSADPEGRRGLMMRIGDLDDVLPIVLGGVVLALMHEDSPPAAISLAVQAAIVALVIALAGWLLVARAASETEERVFIVAILLLLGGAAEYLALSALLGGLIAGGFWEYVGGTVRESIRRDVGHLQHPLMVLVLLVAGARVDLTPNLLALAVLYVLLRTVAKAAGEWLAGRILHHEPRPRISFLLISPGIVGVALALNISRAGGPDATAVLAVAASGALGSEFLALLMRRREGIG